MLSLLTDVVDLLNPSRRLRTEPRFYRTPDGHDTMVDLVVPSTGIEISLVRFAIRHELDFLLRERITEDGLRIPEWRGATIDYWLYLKAGCEAGLFSLQGDFRHADYGPAHFAVSAGLGRLSWARPDLFGLFWFACEPFLNFSNLLPSPGLREWPDAAKPMGARFAQRDKSFDAADSVSVLPHEVVACPDTDHWEDMLFGDTA